MLLDRIKDELSAALESPAHTHKKLVKRHFTRWTQEYDDISRRFEWILYDAVQVPCGSPLAARGRVLVEAERDADGTRVVASRRFYCSEPSVRGASRDVLMYVARKVSDAEAMLCR